MLSKRYALALDLHDDPDLIARYEWLHGEGFWPEIGQGLREVGVLGMEIYRLGTRLFLVMDTVPDFDLRRDFERIGSLPRQAEWAALVAQFQQRLPDAQPHEHWAEMRRIFDLNGR